MMQSRLSSRAAALAVALLLGGCDVFPDDFPVAVGNRTPGTVTVFANGAQIGEIASSQTATFTITLSPTGSTTADAIGNPITPAPIAQATFTARDNATGILSAGAATTLIHGVTAYVDVAPCILLGAASTGLICVSVANTSSGSSGSSACSFSLSPTSQPFDAAGGTGTISVQASGGCSWSAISNITWISVTSGTSGNGNGTVVFQVQPNPTGQARTGSLSIAGQTFTVTQSSL